MTLGQIRDFNEDVVNRYSEGKCTTLEYWNARLFSVMSMSSQFLDDEGTDDDE